MKYLGVDFGLKRVGLAISEGELASPWKVIEGTGVNNLIEKIKVEAKDFDVVIIGMPENKMGEAVQKVINSLNKSGINIEAADETLSSQDAVTLMVELGISKKKRKVNDAHSAAIILQNYLDNR